MDPQSRIEEIDSELVQLEGEPVREIGPGDTDPVSVAARAERTGELEGEKRGLEAVAA